MSKSITGKIASKKSFSQDQEVNYQVNMNKVMTDLTHLIEKSKPMSHVKISHKGITLTIEVDLEKATGK